MRQKNREQRRIKIYITSEKATEKIDKKKNTKKPQKRR